MGPSPVGVTRRSARALRGLKLDALKEAALAELKPVSAIIDLKAPNDAAAFKAWLRDVAQKAADAGTERGFLGFGGVAVREAEKAALTDISATLNNDAVVTT